ncbi:MAG: hypothetical protein ACP5QA_14940 [Phycisphaerae bacterium]
MKNTFGKIGLGLSGAVAAVGLMSAGVQTAQAEFTLLIPPSPVITVGGIVNNQQTYDWTYELTLGGASAASSGSYFEFALSANSGYVGYSSSLVNPGDWTLTQNQTGFYGKDVYSGTALAAGTTIGTFTIITTDGFLGTYTTPTSFTVTSTGGNPATYAVNAVSDGSGTDFASLINPGSSSADFSTQGVVVPDTNGNVPESPLPLPAAFWPGLLTLGGMAVVGGLRLRRRTV